MKKLMVCIFFMLICVLGFLVQGCDNRFESGKMTDNAIKSMQKGDNVKALEEINKALENDKKNPLAKSVKALLLAKNGENGNAKKLITQAVMEDPSNYDIRLNSSQILMLLGDYERAMFEIERASALSKKPLAAICIKSEFLYKEGKKQEALSLLDVMEGEYPKEVRPLITKGSLFLSDKDYAKALEACEKALKIESGNIDALSLKVLILIGKKDIKNAKVLLGELIQEHPNNSRLSLAQAKIDLLENEYVKAEKMLEQAISSDRSNEEAYFLLGTLNMKRGDAQKAEQNLYMAARLNPKNAEAISNRAYIKLVMGKNEEGEKLLEEAIKADPKYAATYVLKSNVLLPKGDLEGAFQLLKQAEELDEKSPMTQLHLARIYVIKRDAEKALMHAEKTLKEEPGNILAFYYKASALAMKGKKKEAFSQLLRAKQLGFNDVNKLKQDFCWEPYEQDPEFQKILSQLEKLNKKK